MTANRIRVAVLHGGRSGEHEVSLKSGRSVIDHLDPGRYDVVPILITPDGRWAGGEGEPGGLAHAIGLFEGVDVVFPALHGEFGEDGTVQSLLEMVGVPYVGNGVFAGAAGMDKEFTKKLLVADGLAVADGVVLRATDETLTPEEIDRLGFPMFVKPARTGSSLGISKVDAEEELAQAIKLAKDFDTKVLVEAAVPGREVDVAVLEHPDGRLEAGPALEIRIDSGHTFFDYEAKYSDATTIFDIPARLDDELREAVERQALAAFRSLGCRGLLRVDFFLRDGVTPVVNEVNTFPGFTAASQFPQMWRAAGVEFPELLDILVTTALARR
ncbi:D-alanine--D-alanine ligase [Amycolatopsis sp. NBC_00345]|uniref:D-alanine--D-alanine ligase family protein n=1 Tax=Amycolatopsis sp. NBC_00345 TaxID=2975955 RepID=UPI002E2582E2